MTQHKNKLKGIIKMNITDIKTAEDLNDYVDYQHTQMYNENSVHNGIQNIKTAIKYFNELGN